MQTPIRSRASNSGSCSGVGCGIPWLARLSVLLFMNASCVSSSLGRHGREADPDPLAGTPPSAAAGLGGQLLFYGCQKIARAPGYQVTNERRSGHVNLDFGHRLAE